MNEEQRIKKNERNRLYKEKNKARLLEYAKNYYHENKESIKKRLKENEEVKKEYLKVNKDKVNKNKYDWAEKNKDKVKLASKKYRETNKDKVNNTIKEYKKHKLLTDSSYKLKERIRTLIRSSFINKGLRKSLKTELILGCTHQEFKTHIESKFQPWMNWENYGKYNGEFNHGWDIDHIKPLVNAKTEEDIIELNHYTNLQPLCSYTNRYIKKHH
jgi:hypothetical protein